MKVEHEIVSSFGYLLELAEKYYPNFKDDELVSIAEQQFTEMESV